MGQNNSQLLQSRSQLAHNWNPHDREPNVFVHRITHEQIHRHFIRILVKDLPRQTALFSTRMNNHQPYICRLQYFHPGNSSQGKFPLDHQKDFREMFIYTDRFLHLKEWNREKMILALHGLRRLISIHGPIRITQHMLCENQYGEIKVWISQNSVNNHPDSKYMSEEQSMGDFAAILTKKNQELANILIGCNTLKQASQRFKSQPEEHQTYSHRASGSGDISKKKEKGLNTPYKNVFGDINDSFKHKPELPITPKPSIKLFQNYSQSSFLPKQEESTPTSNSTTNLSKYKEYIYSSKTSLPNDQKVGNKSNPKNPVFFQFKKRQDHPQTKSNYRPNKIIQSNVESQKTKEFLPFPNSQFKSPQAAKPFTFQNRFQTANLNSFNSPKGRAEPIWNSNESSNLSITFNDRSQFRQNNQFKQQRVKGTGYDITIINNNVNNYISNITHNHIVKVDKSPTEQIHQFRMQPKNQEGTNVHSSNQFLKSTQKNNQKQSNIPVFIQQKKKMSSPFPQDNPSLIAKSKSNYNLSRKYFVSNPQQASCQSPQVGSQKNLQDCFEFTNKSGCERRKQNRGLNFSKDPTISAHNISMNMNNMPSSPQNFSSFQKGYNNSFQLRSPLRTKTTEFYQKKEGPKREELQNKSFTQNDMQKSVYQFKIDKKFSQQQRNTMDTKAQKIQQIALKIAQKNNEQAKPQQTKVQFKKQLRNQFKFLLGGDKQQEPAPKKQQQKAEIKQVNLKDKILRKKIQLAQVKKQASKVLFE